MAVSRGGQKSTSRPKSTEVIPETIMISADCLGDATKGMDQIGNSRDHIFTL